MRHEPPHPAMGSTRVGPIEAESTPPGRLDVINIDLCRELLGDDCPMTDEEIAALRDQLYGIAALALTQTAETPDESRGSP